MRNCVRPLQFVLVIGEISPQIDAKSDRRSSITVCKKTLPIEIAATPRATTK
jgi:hypothetical protein